MKKQITQKDLDGLSQPARDLLATWLKEKADEEGEPKDSISLLINIGQIMEMLYERDIYFEYEMLDPLSECCDNLWHFLVPALEAETSEKSAIYQLARYRYEDYHGQWSIIDRAEREEERDNILEVLQRIRQDTALTGEKIFQALYHRQGWDPGSRQWKDLPDKEKAIFNNAAQEFEENRQ